MVNVGQEVIIRACWSAGPSREHAIGRSRDMLGILAQASRAPFRADVCNERVV